MVTNDNELLGQALGTCTIRQLIGRGGMGAVYLAQQSRPRRTVAVKVLMPGTFLDQRPRAEFLVRFRREADAVAALDHVNIMPIYEYGEQADCAYLVMPYVTGGTLRQLLERRGRLPLSEAVPIIEQAAAALDSAHAQGIIHRDLKPGNILFHADGRVLLADFGLAKMVKDAQEFESHGQTALTSAGTIIGTPEYLSPEQGTGKPVDHRTDVYSLGIVLYQMLSGRVPFQGTSPVAIAIKHALEEPPSLTALNPDIPASVEAVVKRAIAKNPDDRYPSAGEFALALREAASALLPERDPKKAAYSSYETIVAPSALPATDEGETTRTPQREIHIPPIEEGAQMPMFNAAPTEAIPPKQQVPSLTPPQDPPEDASYEKDNVATTPPYHHGWQEQLSPAQPTPQQRPSEPDQPVLETVHNVQQHTIRPDRAAQMYFNNQRPRRRSGQSLLMMLLGSILTLAIVVGGLATYLHFAQQSSRPHTTIHTTATPGETSHAQHKPGPAPAAAISAGPLLYYATFPGPSCDVQGAKWISTPGFKPACGDNGTSMNNAASSQRVGMFLQTLNNGQTMPSRYVVQTQVTLNSDSHGRFGIFFLTQPGQDPDTHVWMVDPSTNTVAMYHYKYATGQSDFSLTPQHIYQGSIGKTVTLDVQVSGNSAIIYVNGNQIGSAADLNQNNGMIGLAADPGADVTFKDLAIYSRA